MAISHLFHNNQVPKKQNFDIPIFICTSSSKDSSPSHRNHASSGNRTYFPPQNCGLSFILQYEKIILSHQELKHASNYGAF